MKSDIYFIKVNSRDITDRVEALKKLLDAAHPFSGFKEDEIIPVKITIGDSQCIYNMQPEMVIYYGWYSQPARGPRRREGRLATGSTITFYQVDDDNKHGEAVPGGQMRYGETQRSSAVSQAVPVADGPDACSAKR